MWLSSIYGGLPFLHQDKQVMLAPVGHPRRGFLVILYVFSRRFPFASFSASAMGYVVTSLRDSRQHVSNEAGRARIGPLLSFWTAATRAAIFWRRRQCGLVF